MNLTNRQMTIAEMVRIDGPITGEQIASRLHVTRAALRSDLAILIMSGMLDARPKVGYFYTGKNTLGMLAEEISVITVRDVQSVPVVVNSNATAKDAVFKMFTEDVGSVYVVNERGLLVGVVSRKDLLKFALNNHQDLAEIPVALAMTQVSKIIFAQSDDSVVSAACKLIDNEIDSLPVVSVVDAAQHEYEIIGRITKTNFTRLFVELAQGKGGRYAKKEN
ncbi:MAG: helix-turn-helix transcriptional regulator [Acidaminococcaceae bacterium]|nr:helix-turn-helix transcriptional regulator [Acidaminococcaceae bacterium]